MKSRMTRISLAGFVFVAMAMLTIETTSAQCSTCVTPTVAYQPVAVQPVVTTQYNGWYPGKLLDNMRLRRYGVAPAVAPAYTPYTASYTPYTAAYPAYTAGYTPYVTGYAPLRRTVVARPVVQTAYYPAVAASPCSTCVQTVARPVALSPIVTTGCSTCGVSACGGCGTCSTCTAVPTGVSPASYTQPGCSSCAGSSVVPSVAPTPSLAPSSQAPTVGPPTPQPTLVPNEAAPTRSNYPTTAPTGTEGSGAHGHLEPTPAQEPTNETTFEAPRLFDPRDRTAQRPSSNEPTVDVWNAVYHQTGTEKVRQMSYRKPVRTQAEIDADGWQAVPSDR